VKGKAAVCFATSGPGATNLITGIADAIMDSTPMVCITGQVPMHLLGTDAFQETDVVGITMPITKWNYQITKAAEIPEVLAKAFYVANTGKPGPVLIDITKNAQFELMEWKGYKQCNNIRGYNSNPNIDQVQLEKAAEIINSSKKPLIIAGQGVVISKAKEVLEQFSAKTASRLQPLCRGWADLIRIMKIM
jgi:acetolactate synthase-1/2/3 large subunit